MAVKFRKTSNGGIPAVATVQASRTTGVTSLTVDTQQFWPTGNPVAFSTYKVDANNKRLAGSQTDWDATSNGTNTLTGLVAVGGAADAGNAIGDKVQMGPTAQWAEDLIDGLLNQHVNDGTHSNVTAITVAASGAITAGSFSTSGSLTANTATVTNTLTVGFVKLTPATVATIDGSGNLTPTTPVFDVTALGGNATLQVPSWTPWNSSPCIVRIFGAASWAFSIATGYTNASGLPTPSSTVAGKWLTLGIMYNSNISKWQILSIGQES